MSSDNGRVKLKINTERFGTFWLVVGKMGVFVELLDI